MKDRKHLITYIVIALCMILTIIFMLSSCSTTKEFRNSTYERYDTIYVSTTEYRVDSVWRDRIQIVELKGDLVYIRDSVVVEKWRFLNSTDTFWREVSVRDTDSIYVETPVVKYERSKYDIFTSYGFWIELVLLIIIFAIFVIKTIMKLNKMS